MLTALFLGACERLQGRADLMEGKYWLQASDEPWDEPGLYCQTHRSPHIIIWS